MIIKDRHLNFETPGFVCLVITIQTYPPAKESQSGVEWSDLLVSIRKPLKKGLRKSC